MYYFDPAFGFIYVTGGNGCVRYGRGPVVPHDPTSLADQRYTQFAGWVPIEPHHVPDEWLIAFGQEFSEPKDEETLVITDGPSEWNWGWAEWTVAAPWFALWFYVVLSLIW